MSPDTHVIASVGEQKLGLEVSPEEPTITMQSKLLPEFHEEEEFEERCLNDSDSLSWVDPHANAACADETDQASTRSRYNERLEPTTPSFEGSIKSETRHEEPIETEDKLEGLNENLSIGFEHSCVAPRSVLRVGEKAVLEAICESPHAVGNDPEYKEKAKGCSCEVEIGWQVDRLTIEKKKLENHLYRIMKDYESRITPFRDVFEDVSAPLLQYKVYAILNLSSNFLLL
jgi:hypothetical protein